MLSLIARVAEPPRLQPFRSFSAFQPFAVLAMFIKLSLYVVHLQGALFLVHYKIHTQNVFQITEGKESRRSSGALEKFMKPPYHCLALFQPKDNNR